MKKVGTTLESHRLWRELLKLDVQAKDKILKDIVDKRFSIGDAIQVAIKSYSIYRWYKLLTIWFKKT